MARSRELHKPLERPPGPPVGEAGPGRFVVLSGPDRGRQLRLDRSVLTVGRNPTCDLVLTDRRVSGRHARVEVGAAGVVVIDRRSTNGTWRAGARVSEAVELHPGDVVTFGEVDVRYELGPADAAPPSAEVAPTPIEARPLPEPPPTMAAPLAAPEPIPAAEPSAVAESPSAVEPAVAGETAVAAEPSAVEPPPAAEPAVAAEPPPARAARPRTVLVSYDPVDRPIADRLVEVLQRSGHLVWIDRSTSGDGWGGRLLDTVWSCDAVVFVVSPAATHSERVRREVHLAGAEHTPVLPVVAAPVDLPPELAFYLARRAPIELWRDSTAGLRRLVDEVSALPRKRVARPRRLFAVLVALALATVLIVAALRYLFG